MTARVATIGEDRIFRILLEREGMRVGGRNVAVAEIAVTPSPVGGMHAHRIGARQSAATLSVTPSRAAYVATLVFVSVVLVLHGLKPEIDPAWRFISEYALGAHGWLMNLSIAWATARGVWRGV